MRNECLRGVDTFSSNARPLTAKHLAEYHNSNIMSSYCSVSVRNFNKKTLGKVECTGRISTVIGSYKMFLYGQEYKLNVSPEAGTSLKENCAWIKIQK